MAHDNEVRVVKGVSESRCSLAMIAAEPKSETFRDRDIWDMRMELDRYENIWEAGRVTSHVC